MEFILREHKENNLDILLMSIKPNFAQKIYDGSKKFEYRRTRIKSKQGICYIYETQPVSKITGWFQYSGIIQMEIPDLWNLTKEFSGISEVDFFTYFQSKLEGNALQIVNSNHFDHYVTLDKRPPQSYEFLQRKR